MKINYPKQLQLTTFIVYSIIAAIGEKILNVHWIHLLNALILSGILYHLLDWKYGEEEPNNENL